METSRTWWLLVASFALLVAGLSGLRALDARGGGPVAHDDKLAAGRCTVAGDDGDALLEAAEDALRAGDNEGALSCAVGADARRPRTHRVMAVAHARMGQRAEALEHQAVVDRAGLADR